MLHYGHDTKPAFTARGFRKASNARKFMPALATDPESGYGQAEFYIVIMLEAGAIRYRECLERLKRVTPEPACDRTTEEWIKIMRPAARQAVDNILDLDQSRFAEFVAKLSDPEDAAFRSALIDSRERTQKNTP
jgi:hypothetical protein